MDNSIVLLPTFASFNDEQDYYASMNDYAERYIELVEDYQALFGRLHECIAFIDHIKIPFCYEYLKCSYKSNFDLLSNEIDALGSSIAEFPDTLREYCLRMILETDHDNKKLCVSYLDCLLRLFNSKVETFKDQVEAYANTGFELYNRSQMIAPNTCR